MSNINIAGIDKAALLAALYEHAVPVGMGMLHFTPGGMSTDDAQALIDGNPRLYFDYVRGRPLKVDLSGEEMFTGLYNRDQGEGAAESIVARLRAASSAAE
jgi:hypothetical protein